MVGYVPHNEEILDTLRHHSIVSSDCPYDLIRNLLFLVKIKLDLNLPEKRVIPGYLSMSITKAEVVWIYHRASAF